ncbi:MAG: glycosyltransferase [Saccharofermentans sp.]|nr:glycosyltransferase [Saccharofermentans sp.]
MKVSVIIPVHNIEKYLRECLDSLMNQTYKDLEIILVENGSIDNSFNICQEYQRKDSRIISCKVDSVGASIARNEGLSRATGEYIAFVDGDDFIEAEYIEYLVRLIEDESADIALCQNYYFNERGKKYVSNKKVKPTQVYDGNRKIMEAFLSSDGVITAPWGKLFKRTVWGDIRFPINNSVEDVMTIYLPFLNANRAVFGEERLYIYRSRELSSSRRPFSSKDLDHIEAMVIRSEAIGKIHPELKSMANSYIVWATNHCIMKMALDSNYDKKSMTMIKSYYKKYERDFLKGQSGIGAKVYSLIASISVSTAMRIYRVLMHV